MAPRASWRLVLSSLIVLASLCSLSRADVTLPDPTRPGLFYFFMSGQIVVVDPVSQKVVTKINQTSQGAPAPFPNSCPGHPMQGTWNRHTTGIDQQTIFITASFQQPTPLRLPGLSDMVLVVNTSSQSVAASVAVPDIPNDIVFVPEVGSVFAHADVNGTFAVISASPPYALQRARYSSEFAEAGYGRLLADSALNGKAFQTASQMPGVFALNLFTQSPDVPFLDLSQAMLQSQPWLPPDTPIYCPATREAVYSAVNRRAYVSCAKAGSPPDPSAPEPGIVEIAGDDNAPVGYLNFKADRLYLTPDETFLLAVDSRASVIRMVQMLPGVGSDQVFSLQWPDVTLPPNSMPDKILFYPKGLYYVALVSLVFKDSTAVIDFNKLLACGAQCPQDNIAGALTFINTGYHVVPRATTDLGISSRSMAVGHQFVCVAANRDKAVYCSNLVNPANNKVYTNMFDVQDIVFVEGKYAGDQSFIRPIDTTFDCSSAPDTLDKPPPPPSPLDLALAAHLEVPNAAVTSLPPAASSSPGPQIRFRPH
ncbi:hypothetical protein CLOM_g22750 [Closterium sp. NIES-68]|nr:hypothetical protein CLOM_g22750 [Closterium sp. NIES-68]GJP60563.1 hypothetical protein CLOP_g17804 [Closterium sp. NIES-67]